MVIEAREVVCGKVGSVVNNNKQKKVWMMLQQVWF
jgi:hypothetical protein